MSKNQQFRSASDIEQAVSQMVNGRVRALVSAELHRIAEEYGRELPKRRTGVHARSVRFSTGQSVSTRMAQAHKKAKAKRGALAQAIRKSLTAVPTTPNDIRLRARKLEPAITSKNTSVILSNLFHKGECQRTGQKYKYKYFVKR